MAEMSIWSPAASVGLIIAGLVIEACFAVIAACMVLALVESYLVISMGVIFMAFGGSRWTNDLAISTVRYTLSVGAKLFDTAAPREHRHGSHSTLGRDIQ